MGARPSALERLGVAFDRVVGVFDPAAQIKRAQARNVLHRAYEAASPRDAFRPRRATASANTDHRADAATLRAKARALRQNVPYIARGLQSLVSNTIGTGIVPRSKAPNASQIDELWQRFTAECDADGRLNWYAMQAAAYQAMKLDGEVLIRLRPRRVEDGLAVPLQLQLLEIDWLDSAKDGTTAAGGAIVNGIQYDALGKVEGYWLFDQHPGDTRGLWGFGRVGVSRLVPAARIIHLYNPERPGQGRGFTALASVIARVRDLMLYEDAELARKNTESRLSVLVSGNVEALRQDDAKPTDGRDLGVLGSGNVIGLPEGSSITTVEPKSAGGYVEYVRYQLHLIAAGMGVTYPMLTGDVSQSSFVSERVNIMEFRRNAEAEQWLLLVPNLCDRVWRAFVDAAHDAGAIPRADYAVDYSTPRWDYVNPADDVRADQLAVATGLASLSETLRRRGYKPDDVFAEIKADFERLRADNTLDVLLMLQAKQAPQALADTPS